MADVAQESIVRIEPGFYSLQSSEDEELPEYIQGKTAGSKLEARVALALEYYDIDYIYQYNFNGGNQIRGGQVIDFIAKTVPIWTPIYVQGEYWHSKKQEYEDTIKIREFARATRSVFADPVVLRGKDLQTLDSAKLQIKEKVI